MHIQNKIKGLTQLGIVMKAIGAQQPWGGFDWGITKEEFEELEFWVQKAKIYNGWFEEKEIRRAFGAWGSVLTEEKINNWLSNYNIPEQESNKTTAIIMAGNIPLVGFHDLLCVYLSGQQALIKLSTDDDKLIPALLKVWTCFDVNIPNRIKITQGKLENFDAVLATGSNNSARYFESYFGKYPHIIRKNRTSVALLNGTETDEELKALADDIFAYYGLGCRNVTKLYLPQGFDLDRIFKGLFHYQNVTDNKKYGNNYDYHKAIFLLERYDLLENGFILLKQDESLLSPIGTLYYEYYNDKSEIEAKLKQKTEQIQCIVAQDKIPFGQAQIPQLNEYADGIDTMGFLLGG